MTLTKKMISAVAILTAMGLASGAFADNVSKSSKADQPGEIEWLRYDEAWLKAQEENKHVLIDFTAVWCGWCKRMDKDTFSKPEVIKMISDNFVAAQVWDHKEDTLDIDGYKIREKDFGKSQFGVTSYPQFWFVSPDGKRIGPIKGYLPAENFMKALTWVKDREYENQVDKQTQKSEASKGSDGN